MAIHATDSTGEPMNDVNLSAIDLNLLVVFEALIDTRHVTRAGQRLGLSQPATSRALARLRVLLDDPVLVKTGRGMRPTPRALELRDPIAGILDDMRRTLSDVGTFDAGTANTTFVVYTDDYVGLVLSSGLVRILNESGDGLGLRLRTISKRAPLELFDHGADVLAAAWIEDTRDLIETTLFRDEFATLVDANHPALRGDSMQIDDFAAFGHALIASPGESRGVVDTMLEAHGLTRDVRVTVPHFLLAPRIIQGTDLVLTAPRRALEAIVRGDDLKIISPPLDLPALHVRAWIDPATTNDSRVAWLVGAMQSAC